MTATVSPERESMLRLCHRMPHHVGGMGMRGTGWAAGSLSLPLSLLCVSICVSVSVSPVSLTRAPHSPLLPSPFSVSSPLLSLSLSLWCVVATLCLYPSLSSLFLSLSCVCGCISLSLTSASLSLVLSIAGVPPPNYPAFLPSSSISAHPAPYARRQTPLHAGYPRARPS